MRSPWDLFVSRIANTVMALSEQTSPIGCFAVVTEHAATLEDSLTVHLMHEGESLGATDPVSYFIEQRGWDVLIILGVLAIAYLILISGITFLLRRRIKGSGRSFLMGAAISIVVFVVVMTVYQNLALYFRFVPPGSGAQRQDGTFAFLATIGVWFIYALLLAFAWWVGQNMTQSRRQTMLTVGLVALFFVLTLPWVDFISQCMIGRGLGLPVGSC